RFLRVAAILGPARRQVNARQSHPRLTSKMQAITRLQLREDTDRQQARKQRERLANFTMAEGWDQSPFASSHPFRAG
ncbi:MAG: hypothetical protein ACE5HB_02940, partial [Terriglobia bacterium]